MLSIHQDFVDTPWDAIAHQIQLNVVSLTELTHRFARAMLARSRGYILNIASVGAYTPTESRDAWHHLVEVLRRANAKPIIDSTWNFEHLKDAFARLSATTDYSGVKNADLVRNHIVDLCK